MQIEQQCVINVPPRQVWAFLTDPYQVVSCLPGASITEKLDDRTYAGTMTVKIGPVTASYKGKICFEHLDPETYTAEITGRGQEGRGKGSAEMRMESRLQALQGGGAEVTVLAEVNLIGPLAQFGRGVIQDVSDQLFRQFTASMKQQLEAAKPSDRPDVPTKPEPVDVLSLSVGALCRALGRMLGRIFGFSKP